MKTSDCLDWKLMGSMWTAEEECVVWMWPLHRIAQKTRQTPGPGIWRVGSHFSRNSLLYCMFIVKLNIPSSPTPTIPLPFPNIEGIDSPLTLAVTISVCLYHWWIIYSPQVTSHLPTHHPIYLSPPVKITPRSKNNTRLAKVNILDKGKLLSLTSWQEMLFRRKQQPLVFTYSLVNWCNYCLIFENR